MWCLCRPFRWLSSLLYAGGTKDLCRTYRKVKKLQNTPALFHAENILRQHVWVHGSLGLCTAGSYRGGGYATARRCHLWQRLHVQALVFPYSVAYNVSVSEFNPYYMKIKTSPTHVKQRRAVSLCDSWISCPTNILSRVHTEHCAHNFWGYETWGNLGTSENSEGHRSDWIDAEILHQKNLHVDGFLKVADASVNSAEIVQRTRLRLRHVATVRFHQPGYTWSSL